MNETRSISFITVLSLGLVAGTYFALASHTPEEIRQFIAAQGALAPVAFVLLKFASNVILPLGATPFFLAAEPLFGTRTGFICLFLGNLSGYAFCFVSARRFAVRKAGQLPIKATSLPTTGVKGGDVLGLLLRRAFMFGLQDLVSYSAGLTAISFGDYLGITAAATSAQAIVGMTIGRALMSGPVPLLAGYAIFTVVVVPALWVRLQRRRLGESSVKQPHTTTLP